MKIQELEKASGVKPRSIRQYISLGLVKPPHGRTRSATYTSEHLADLVNVRNLLQAGLSLEEIEQQVKSGRRGSRTSSVSPDVKGEKAHLL